MRVLASSDFHGNLPHVPDCDLFLIVGDICPDFGERGKVKLSAYGLETNGLQQAEWLDTVFRAWLDQLSSRGITVVGCWGNHDFVGEHPHLIPKDLKWILLQDEGVMVHGLHIWATPWCPKLKFWAFYARPEALLARAFRIPTCDILMTHSPPLGAGDVVGVYYGGPEHVGDPALADELRRREIAKVVLCGHIHEDHGVHYLTNTPHVPIMNVSYVNERYEPTNEPVEVIEFSYPN